jgi:hypothetical protein
MKKVIARDVALEKKLNDLLKQEEKEFKNTDSHLPLEKRQELLEMKLANLMVKKDKLEQEIQESKTLTKKEKHQDIVRLNAEVRHFQHGIDGIKDAIEWRNRKDIASDDYQLRPAGDKLIKDKISSFPLPAGHTCPKKGTCKGHCFALSGRTADQSNCLDSYSKKLGMAERDDFVAKINNQLAKKNPVTPPWKDRIRIHPWGDFYSNKYAEKWLQIAKDNPAIWFYAYTKSHQMPAIKEMMKLPNVKIIQSYNGKHDENISDNKPHCKVFEDDAALAEWNRKNPDKAYTQCSDSDLVAADPAVIRLAVVKHGKTYNPKGFNIETLAKKGKKQDKDIHFAHHYDQIDAPHNWTREQHAEHQAIVEEHRNAGEPFKAQVESRYNIKK